MSSIIGGTTGITFPDSTVQTTAATTPTAVANLSGGAAGKIPFQTGSSTTSFTAAGTTGQVLTSAGTGTPTWSTPSAGAMTLISTQTLTGFTVGSLQWTGLTGYNKYQLIWDNVTNDTSTMSLAVQIGTGSGPTYLSSGYNYQSVYNNSTSANATSTSNVSNWYISKSFNASSSGGSSGNIVFTGITTSNTAYFVGTTANITSGSTQQTAVVGGMVATGAPITAIQIFNYIGANLNGTFSLYGISS